MSVEDAGSQLHEKVNAARRPMHLLLLGETLRNHLVDSRLDEGGRNHLAIAVPLGVIRNEIGVVADVAAELLQISPQLAYLWWWVADQIEAIAESLNQLKRSADVAVPQIVPHAFEGRDSRRRCGAERRWQAAGHLLERCNAHGDGEIVENMLLIGAHVILKVSQIAGAIRHEGHFLVHRDALTDQKLV
ncbi:hypothetical protein [Mesorhizobium sp. M0244]|uniref:hypothetical protein n=1 Tax=Mesorhizobium sp. M0244 TaxID=2956926 RepID=UPI00333DBBD4